MSFNKRARRQRIRYRIRNKITGTAERPRVSVFRSNKQIYAQIINDADGKTLASASSRAEGVDGATPTDRARQVGKLLAEQAKAAGIERVIFDRGGYLYHGRVKALAEGAREGGLNF